MNYYMVKVSSQPFEAVIADVVEQLRAEGFGVLTDIDVQATLQAKLGASMPKYRILGACNPRFAHEALQMEGRLGVLLPCNVIVRELPDGKVEVASIDPVSSLERTENLALASMAEDVRQRLSKMLARIAA